MYNVLISMLSPSANSIFKKNTWTVLKFNSGFTSQFNSNHYNTNWCKVL